MESPTPAPVTPVTPVTPVVESKHPLLRLLTEAAPTRLPILPPGTIPPWRSSDEWFQDSPMTKSCAGGTLSFSDILKYLIQEKKLRHVCVPYLILNVNTRMNEVYIASMIGGLFKEPEITNVPGIANFILEECKDQPLIAIPMWIVGTAHTNALIIDRERREYERFEPHGHFLASPEEDRKVNYVLENNKDLKGAFGLHGYRYISPFDFCPSRGPQILSKEKECPDVRGFCPTWSLYYMLQRILNPRWSREAVLKHVMTPMADESLLTKIRKFQGWIEGQMPAILKTWGPKRWVQFSSELPPFPFTVRSIGAATTTTTTPS